MRNIDHRAREIQAALRADYLQARLPSRAIRGRGPLGDQAHQRLYREIAN